MHRKRASGIFVLELRIVLGEIRRNGIKKRICPRIKGKLMKGKKASTKQSLCKCNSRRGPDFIVSRQQNLAQSAT